MFSGGVPRVYLLRDVYARVHAIGAASREVFRYRNLSARALKRGGEGPTLFRLQTKGGGGVALRIPAYSEQRGISFISRHRSPFLILSSSREVFENTGLRTRCPIYIGVDL